MDASGQRFICGVCPPENDDPDCTSTDDLDIVNHEEFEDIIWPVLYERFPAFGALKVQGSWAGFYEYNTFDFNGIIGPHSDRHNLFLINGFSGTDARNHVLIQLMNLLWVCLQVMAFSNLPQQVWR